MLLLILQFVPVLRSCSIIYLVIMYLGLPPELADNANGFFSFGRKLDAFKISDDFPNNTALTHQTGLERNFGTDISR